MKNFLHYLVDKHPLILGLVFLIISLFVLNFLTDWFFGSSKQRYYLYGCGKYYPDIQAVENCRLLQYEAGKEWDPNR